MNKKLLLFVGSVISALALLFLLFMDVANDKFVLLNWSIVSFDLLANIIINIYIMITEKDEE